MSSPGFDLSTAHRFFAAECFNLAWDLIDQPTRSDEENERMLLTALASLWHWSQRPDATPRELSIGHWQVSRVYSLLGQAANAEEFGNRSLRHSADLAPFYLGYAYEALARAARLAGDKARVAQHLSEARQYAARVTDEGERAALEKDLATI